MSKQLIDELLPRFEYGNRYSIDIPCGIERVASAVETYRLDESFVVRLLFRLRGLQPPGRLRSHLVGRGFTVLAESPGRQVVVGIAGRFWALNQQAGLIPVQDAREFIAYAKPGTAKCAATIVMEPLSDTRTRLTTETRVLCCDRAARREFAAYWVLIRPMSAWIRRILLRGVREKALATA